MENDRGPKFSKPKFVQPDEAMVPPPSPQELLIEEAPALSTEVIEGKPVSDEEKKKKTATPFQESIRRLRRDKRAMFCLAVIVLYVLIAIFGTPIYKLAGPNYKSDMTNTTIPASVYRDFTHQEADRKHEGPSAQYWLGTDSIGRDLLSRLMQGMLISIAVATVVEIIDIFLGVTIGVLAGYYGGWIDFFLARFTDVIFAFPGLLFIILLVGILGSKANDMLGNIPVIGANGNARLLFVSVGLALTVWPLMARYVRGQTLQLKEQQFIEAARTSGATDFTIILRHLIPNLFSIVIIASTLNIANTIISEAGISLLGLGVQPPGSSIGLMISDATDFLQNHPWEALMPSFVLVIIVLAFSFLGDGLRDAFDPRSKD
ncbi:ABC transporter permease [Dictyobacter kobayashii]|uniref:Glutathione transport system permease protein GsiD n=1 Tax=Dictyobacter kobayashii TaxID=2014872 RepID=A0A402ALA3_9CHLR|nr:ABC transporter permease [Dictyobacter kobayashii]GCE19906.1 glutathione transport system permease protein GsiD [Dictyobacter kobayashii]